MGEWLAWLPTVSLLSRSTDVSNGFGPGTSRRCRARVIHRRGRGWFCAGLLAFPAGYWATLKCTGLFVSGVSVGVATGVPSAVGSGCCLRRELCSACRLEARPGLGPVGALHTGGAWSVMNGQAAAPPALSTPAVHGVHARYSIRSTSTCAFALPNRCARHQFRMQFPCDYFKV